MNRLSTLVALSALAHPAIEQRTSPPTCTSTPETPRAGSPVDLHVKIQSNHFVITVCRGDRPLTFVLDTGAGVSIIDMSLAKELGIETVFTSISRGGGNGGSAAAVTRRDSVRIAGTDIVVPFQQAIDFRDLNSRGRMTIDGILGADFIERFVLGLDYRDSVLRVYDRTTFDYSGRGTAVPFTMANRFIFVKGELALADGARIPGRFVVDVGASGALSLAKPFVDANHLRDRVGPTISRETGRGVGGSLKPDIGRAQTFSIGGVALERPIVSLFGDSAGVFSNGSLGDGNIGGDILRRFTVLLDYAKHELIFERHAGSDDPFEMDMTGLALVPRSRGADGLLVESVMARSPAANAGLVAGDTVTAIEGKRASMTALTAVRPRMLRDGERLTFTVRRNGVEVEIRVVTKRLV